MSGAASGTARGLPVIPGRYQPKLPVERLIRTEPPDADATPMDVVFVGGGPAGLAGAIELARLVKRDNAAGVPGDVLMRCSKAPALVSISFWRRG